MELTCEVSNLEFFYMIGHYIDFCIQSLKISKLPSFEWKFLQIGTQRAKDPRKNVPILQEGEFAPPTPPLIRVVLLHKQGYRVILYFLKSMLLLEVQWVNNEYSDATKTKGLILNALTL